MASYCSSRSFWILVCKLPRRSSNSRSGRSAEICAFLRLDDVPTVALCFNERRFLISTQSLWIINNSAGSSRSETAAMINPGGLTVGKSLCECTAKSMVPLKSSSSSSLVKNPLPSNLSKRRC